MIAKVKVKAKSIPVTKTVKRVRKPAVVKKVIRYFPPAEIADAYQVGYYIVVGKTATQAAAAKAAQAFSDKHGVPVSIVAG